MKVKLLKKIRQSYHLGITEDLMSVCGCSVLLKRYVIISKDGYDVVVRDRSDILYSRFRYALLKAYGLSKITTKRYIEKNSEKYKSNVKRRQERNKNEQKYKLKIDLLEEISK